MADRIEPERPERIGLVGRWRMRWCGTAPPEYRTNPRQQLARIEWLGQVIVGPHFQPDDAIHVLAARRQHDDRQRLIRTQPPRQRQAVIARQQERKSTRLNSSPYCAPRMPSSA